MFILNILLALAQPTASFAIANDLTIVYGTTPRLGPVTQGTTRTDLDLIFGKKSLKDGNINVGVEDEVMRASTEILTKGSEAVVIWDSPSRKKITRVLVTERSSKWHTSEGIKIGMSILGLEKINGKPFKFSGLGWDYGGQIEDETGALSKMKNMILTLGSINDEATRFFGDRVHPMSNTPGIAKAGIEVSRIELLF